MTTARRREARGASARRAPRAHRCRAAAQRLRQTRQVHVRRRSETAEAGRRGSRWAGQARPEAAGPQRGATWERILLGRDYRILDGRFRLVADFFLRTWLVPFPSEPSVLRSEPSAPFPNRRVASSSCRCSAPMTRPSDSADRSSKECSSTCASRGLRAGGALRRFAIHAPPRGPLPAFTREQSKVRARELRIRTE